MSFPSDSRSNAAADPLGAAGRGGWTGPVEPADPATPVEPGHPHGPGGLGDLVVPVGRPTLAYYPPGSGYGPRQVDRFEFDWVIAGSADWQCGRRRHTLTPGTLLLVRPGMTDRFRWDVRRPSRLGHAQFDLRPGTGVDLDGWPVTRVTGPDDPLRGLARYLLWLGGQQPEHWAARVRDTLGLMLTVFVHGPLPATPATTATFAGAAAPGAARPGPVGTLLPAVLTPVVDHVRAAWSTGPLRPLSRAELSRAGAMSAGHLSRVFREHCGVGAVAAFELLRLMRAEALLRRSDLTVRAIAEACGFADPYHFSHRFKAAYGVSPRALRDGAPSVRPDPGDRPGVRLLAHLIWSVPGG